MKLQIYQRLVAWLISPSLTWVGGCDRNIEQEIIHLEITYVSEQQKTPTGYLLILDVIELCVVLYFLQNLALNFNTS